MTKFGAVPSRGTYSVRRSDRVRAVAAGLTREQAWREARRLARGADGIAYLHDSTGRVVTRNDYRKA